MMIDRGLSLFIGTHYEHGYGHIARGATLTAALLEAGWYVDVHTQDLDVAHRFLVSMKLARRLRLIHSTKRGGSPEQDVVVVDDPSCRNVETMSMLSECTELLVAIQDRTASSRLADLVVFPDAHTSDRSLAVLSSSDEAAPLVVRGWDYVMLSQTALATQRTVSVWSKVERVVVVAGGSDPDSSSVAVTKALLEAGLERDQIAVQIGLAMVHLTGELMRIGVKVETFSHQSVANASLAVVAFGVSVYECIYWGVPTLTYGRDTWTCDAASMLGLSGSVTDIGRSTQIDQTVLVAALDRLPSRGSTVSQIDDSVSRKSNPIDGLGAVRVAHEITRLAAISGGVE